MIQQDMIEINQSDKIQALFTNLVNKKTKILLWQCLDSGHRVKHEAILKEYNWKKDELSFPPKGDVFSFNVSSPIYFYSNKRTTIFKNQIYFNSQFKLAVKTPENLLLRNLRLKQRDSGGDELVSLLFGESIKGSDSFFKAGLIDRGVGGFSFQYSPRSVLRLKRGQKLNFKFKTMGNYSFCEIVDIVPFRSTDNPNLPLNRICTKLITV